MTELSSNGIANSVTPNGVKSIYKLSHVLDFELGDSINDIKFSPDGSYVAACTSRGMIRVFETSTYKNVATFSGHSRGVSCIAFSPINPSILASGSDDLTIRIWSIEKQKCIRILKKHTYHVTTLVFNSKGNLLVSGAADETIIVWDLTSGKSLKTLAAHSDPISSVCLTPDETVIVSASYDGLMRLFDLETGQCLKTLVYNSSTQGTATASTNDVVNFPISCVSVTPNGSYILSSSLDGKIRLWDYMTNRVVKTYGCEDGVNTKYNSASRFVTCTLRPMVVSGSDKNGLLVWDVQTKEVVSQTLPGLTVLGIDIKDGGADLAVGCLSGEAMIFRLDNDGQLLSDDIAMDGAES